MCAFGVFAFRVLILFNAVFQHSCPPPVSASPPDLAPPTYLTPPTQGGAPPRAPPYIPVLPINALYLHRPHLSLTPSTSGMRRHRPYPIRLRPLPGSVRPRPSLTAEGRRADCAGARQRRGLLTPTRISLREGGKAIAGLTAGRTRSRASRRRSQRPREKGAGEAPRDGRCERGGGGPGLCWTEPASVGPGGRGRALRRRASRNPHAVSPEGEASPLDLAAP